MGYILPDLNVSSTEDTIKSVLLEESLPPGAFVKFRGLWNHFDFHKNRIRMITSPMDIIVLQDSSHYGYFMALFPNNKVIAPFLPEIKVHSQDICAEKEQKQLINLSTPDKAGKICLNCSSGDPIAQFRFTVKRHTKYTTL